MSSKEVRHRSRRSGVLDRELPDERLKNSILNEVIDTVDREKGTGYRKKYLEGRYVEDSGKKE